MTTRGQGGPWGRAPAPNCHQRKPVMRVRVVLWGILALMLNPALPTALGQESGTAEGVQAEFRIVWGGPIPRSFQGRISVDSGSLRLVRNLSLEPDAVGGIRANNLSSLEITPHHPSTFGGVDVAVQGTLDTQLTVAIQDPFTQTISQHSVPLSDVLQGNWLEPLDERGTRLAVERQVHDRIRVQSDREHYVFDTDSRWEMIVSGNRTGLPAGEYALRVQVVGAERPVMRVMEQSVQVDEIGNFPPVQVTVVNPREEGAYELEITLHQRRILGSLITSAAELVRRVELVAFDPLRPREVIADWIPLAEVDALKASKPGILSWLSPIRSPATMTDRWQQFNPLAGSLHQPLSHGTLGARHVLGGQEAENDCLTLGSDAWLAIPLGGLAAEVPHRVQIRIPMDQPQNLAASIRRSHADGSFHGIGSDYRIEVGKRDCVAGGEASTHELLFWPSAYSNYLILANSDPEHPASILDIRLDRAVLETEPRTGDAERTSATRPAGDRSERLVGVYLDKPLLADCFSTDRVEDPATGRLLESWRTWQAACVRLEQYLTWSEANLVVMKVQADGAALFPSSRLKPTLRYDSGPFFSDGRSPDLKDVVELWLRHCDRSGIQVVLALDLDTAFPELMRWENSPASGESIFQQPLQPDVGSLSGRYDPLNTKFQSELVAVVREISNRYRHHPAFAGIQLQLDRDSQLVFAGDKWGYSERTLADFQHYSQAKLPSRQQLADPAAAPLRLALLNWRASELSKLFQRLGDVVAATRSDRKLYLDAVRLWDEEPFEKDFYNPAAIVRNPTEYMLALGIDTTRLRSLSNVVLLQGRFQQAPETLNAKDWIRQVAQQRGLQPADSQAPAAALVVQQPSRYALREFSKFNEAVDAAASEVLFPLNASPAQAMRKSLVEQLYDSDVEVLSSGAWLPEAAQSSVLRELRTTIRSFPPTTLADIPLLHDKSNLRVRVGQHAGKTYLQLVNNSSWQEEVALAVQSSLPEPPVRVLGRRHIELQSSNPSSPGDARAVYAKTWQFRMAPYDVVGFEVSDAQFRVLDVAHAPADQVLTKLANELAKMEAVISQAADPTQQVPLANLLGDFEQWSADGDPAGWSRSSLPNVRIMRSPDLPHSGQSSLLIENNNDGNVSAWIQSGPIQAPETGRLALRVWLRSSAVEGSPLVRLSVFGRLRSGQRFERSQRFGDGEGQREIANDWGTRPATLFVSDIPKDQIREIFVSVEVLGRGRVWVDDAEVLQAWLHPDERIYLQGRMFVAKQKLAENNPFPAEQLLDSHWGRYLAEFHSPTTELSSTEMSARRNSTRTNGGKPSSQSNWNSSPNLFQQMRDSMRERWRR